MVVVEIEGKFLVDNILHLGQVIDDVVEHKRPILLPLPSGVRSADVLEDVVKHPRAGSSRSKGVLHLGWSRSLRSNPLTFGCPARLSGCGTAQASSYSISGATCLRSRSLLMLHSSPCLRITTTSHPGVSHMIRYVGLTPDVAVCVGASFASRFTWPGLLMLARTGGRYAWLNVTGSNLLQTCQDDPELIRI